MSWRYKFAFLVINFLFFLVVVRLFYWQVVKASDLSSLAKEQYGNVVKIQPRRGDIETSDGYPIAGSKLSYLVFANPKEVKYKNTLANTLSTDLDIDKASISASLSQDKFWVPIATNVDAQTKEKVARLNLPGVGFEESYARSYPEASLGATLLGFVGKDENGAPKGYFGLEGYYERLLHGKEGVAIQIKDALGQPILAKMHSGGEEVNGSSLILSVNREIQFMVEDKLKTARDRYQAESASAIIMNPKTGEIVAMASFPSFDPQHYQDFSNNEFKNPLITDLYEPGSTLKPIVMASAIDAGLLKPDSRCPRCSGPVPVGGYSIHTWNDKYYGSPTMTEVIIHSDNTGMVYVAQTLGLDRMLSYLNKFKIGNQTGIDLQGEVSASLKPKYEWHSVDLATTGFGQGISITPIELMQAFSALANGGVIMQPRLVSQIVTPEGKKVSVENKKVSQPISQSTAKIMTEILVQAVNKGEAQYARVKGYRIAGKTGTASIPIEGHYDPTQTIASFIGYAPAEDPKFLMLVIFNRPKASIYGAETAAPVFFDIARNLLTYYQIPPTGD